MNPVVDEADAESVVSGRDTSATVVATDDDVFDLEDENGVFDNREAIEIGGADEIGDIAVDEDLAGREADDLVRGDAAVGASDPEVSRALLVDEPRKEIRIGREVIRRPFPIVRVEAGEGHRGLLAGLWSSGQRRRGVGT